jgi:hypothetical protein
MPDVSDEFKDELVASFVGEIPFVGNVLSVFAKRGSKAIRQEWARNSSEALRAAERMSGLSREDLTDRICESPRLIPLVVRVLYTAGMTGQDTILRALGTTLGDAIRDPEKVDEAELLLIGMANLRRHHVVILEIIAKRPGPDNPNKVTYWTPETLADKSTYSRYLVDICVAGLVQSGLISQAGDSYGVSYIISDLGRTALEVLDELDEESRSAPQPGGRGGQRGTGC